jgi:hypothetical protein
MNNRYGEEIPVLVLILLVSCGLSSMGEKLISTSTSPHAYVCSVTRELYPRSYLKVSMGSSKGEDVESPVMDISEGETKGMGEEARLATELEHQMTFLEAVKLYPGAVGWSIFFSIGVIMTAFDPQLLGNLYDTPAFQKDFGYLYEGEYIISAAWQTGLGMGNPIGQCVGALAAAYPMEWWGRKKVSLYLRCRGIIAD